MDKDKDILYSGNFDRDYGIEELVTRTHTSLFFQNAMSMGITFVGLFYPNGTCYLCSNQDHDLTKTTLDFHKNHSDFYHINEKTLAYPIVHQFDTLAFLVVEFPDETKQVTVSYNVMMQLFCNILDQMIGGQYKNLMTSGLHSQVVKDSYEEITFKNEMLEKSEKKYRLLAQSLEEEVHRKGEEIKEAHTQLMHQEKLASIGQLAAGVAHEINNPMGFISSNLRTLGEYTQDLVLALSAFQGVFKELESRDALPPDIKAKEKWDIIAHVDLDYLVEDIPLLIKESMEGTERINKIVSDLKDFAHPGEETPSYADVIVCIESTMNIVWNELKYKAKVIRSFEPVPQIYCFPRQLNQVIMNLLVNAAHAIDKMGDIEIITRDQGEWVELSVRDTGKGIPDDILPKIFDPFFTTKDVGKGTGLGLNLAYNIVKKHKGKIQVKSEVGQGTTFTILLPVNADL